MKKKEFWAGMATMLLLISMIMTVSAITGTVNQELTYNNIGIMLNGKKLNLVDANGNSVEPFMFNGTNYLPVRAISEALGLEVEWDSATATIVLTSKSDNQENESTAIEELLFAKESIRFYYTGYKKTDDGYEINLKIENDSDYKISGRIGPDALAGNKKVTMRLSCETEPGRTSEGKIFISASDLEKAEITEFKRIKAMFSIYEAKSDPRDLDPFEFSTGFITIELK